MNRYCWLNLLLFFAVVAGVVAVQGCTDTPPARSGSVSEPDPEYVAPEKDLTSFEFTDQLGKPFDSKSLEGKVWLGSFFFADCPSICVEQNDKISTLHRKFADQGVEIVSMTVAPDKDSSPKLWAYAERFKADHNTWKFLSGKDIKYVRQVGLDIFGLPAADETHTSDVAVFDRSGEMQGVYNVLKDRELGKCILLIDKLLVETLGDETGVEEVSEHTEKTEADVSEATDGAEAKVPVES